jgi:hypothetical protein
MRKQFLCARTLWLRIEPIEAGWLAKNRHFTHHQVNERNGLWLLKNSFSPNCRKQNCVRMRYKRSSRIPRHFVSPILGRLAGKQSFSTPTSDFDNH